MRDQSVFQVARELIEQSEKSELSPIALQKLCFFSFAWFARLTGQKLYPEQTWAMKHGPVVGDLLSAHSKQESVSSGDIDRVLDEWKLDHSFGDPYVEEIIHAVYEGYSHLSYWELRELSHTEDLWKSAWGQRGSAARARMDSDAMVDYYLSPAPHTSGVLESGKPFSVHLSLPDPLVIVAEGEILDRVEERSPRPHDGFVERLRKLAA